VWDASLDYLPVVGHGVSHANVDAVLPHCGVEQLVVRRVFKPKGLEGVGWGVGMRVGRGSGEGVVGVVVGIGLLV
jgi:hypothetical protein